MNSGGLLRWWPLVFHNPCEIKISITCVQIWCGTETVVSFNVTFVSKVTLFCLQESFKLVSSEHRYTDCRSSATRYLPHFYVTSSLTRPGYVYLRLLFSGIDMEQTLKCIFLALSCVSLSSGVWLIKTSLVRSIFSLHASCSCTHVWMTVWDLSSWE